MELYKEQPPENEGDDGAPEPETMPAIAADRPSRLEMSDLDWAILNQLTLEPHMSARVMAENLGTTANQIVARLRKLDRKNAFHVMAALDLKTLGQSFAFVMIGIRGRPVADVAADLCAIPEVLMACSTIGHGPDLLLIVRFADQSQLIDILYTKMAKFKGVYRIETAMVLDAPVFHALYLDFSSNDFFDDTERLKSDVRAVFSEDIIDDIDAGIIAELQQDGRRSIRSVARKSGLNAGTVRYRIRSLEARGLIHFVTLLNPHVVAQGQTALLTLNVAAGAIDDVLAKLSGLRWLPQLFLCAGASTFIGVAIADSLETLIDLKCRDVDPLDGVIDAEILPFIHVYWMDARWAQKARQQID